MTEVDLYERNRKMNEQLLDEIDARFKHYPPKDQVEIHMHETIRKVIKQAAIELTERLPIQVTSSREFSQTLTDLENAMYHANAAYARHK